MENSKKISIDTNFYYPPLDDGILEVCQNAHLLFYAQTNQPVWGAIRPLPQVTPPSMLFINKSYITNP